MVSVNGAPTSARTASEKAEAEDGEIEDARMSDAPAAEGLTSTDTDIIKTGEVLEDAAGLTQSVASASRQPSPTPEESQALRVESSPATLHSEVKPSAPSQTPFSVRPDVTRNSSSTSVNGRVQHNLPNKPEVPPPRVGDLRMPLRPGDRGTHDYARDSRFPERTGPRDLLRDRGLERSVSGPHSSGHERPSERAQLIDRDRWTSESASLARNGVEDRYGPSNVREMRPLHRDDRPDRPPMDRTYPEHHQNRRDLDVPSQHARDVAMPPPRSHIPQHPDRAALIHGQGPDRVHLSSNPADRRNEFSRHDNHSHSERSSRGPSPTRTDDRRPARYETRRDDRPPNDGRRAVDDTLRPSATRSE